MAEHEAEGELKPGEEAEEQQPPADEYSGEPAPDARADDVGDEGSGLKVWNNAAGLSPKGPPPSEPDANGAGTPPPGTPERLSEPANGGNLEETPAAAELPPGGDPHGGGEGGVVMEIPERSSPCPGAHAGGPPKKAARAGEKRLGKAKPAKQQQLQQLQQLQQQVDGVERLREEGKRNRSEEDQLSKKTQERHILSTAAARQRVEEIKAEQAARAHRRTQSTATPALSASHADPHGRQQLRPRLSSRRYLPTNSAASPLDDAILVDGFADSTWRSRTGVSPTRSRGSRSGRVHSPSPSVLSAKSGTPRRPAVDQRGSVFKSATVRFRKGDIMGSGGVPLITTNQSERTPLASHQHAEHTGNPSYGVSTVALRKRYPKPSRWSVEHWGDRAQCVGRAACDARCIILCDSTVWSAERNGDITIREKDGTVFAIVERDADAPAITTMLYVPSSMKGGRVLVGHSDGSILCLDATTAERCNQQDVFFHSSDVTHLSLVYYGISSSLAISASEDCTMVLFDVHTLDTVSSFMQHPSPVLSVVTCGPYTYSGCADGSLHEWDTNTSLLLSSHSLGNGPVLDLLLLGRHLWCAIGVSSAHGAPLLILDITSMSVAAAPLTGAAAPGAGTRHASSSAGSNHSSHSLADGAPTSTSPVSLVNIGHTVWSVHSDGSIIVWNAQTLEPMRTVPPSDGSQRTVLSAVKVPTAPEDHEIWTLSDDGFVQMWRNHEYILPIWCQDAYVLWSEEINEVREEAKQTKALLSLREEKIAQLEMSCEKLKDDLVQETQLQQSVQELAVARSQGFETENRRRKHIEVELGDLRQCIVNAHRQLTPPKEHLPHYKQTDLMSVVQWLVQTAQLGPPGIEPASPAPTASPGKGEAKPPAATEGADAKESSKDKEREPPKTVVICPACIEKGEQVPLADYQKLQAERAALQKKNDTLEEDNLRLKEMLEAVKSSHRRTNLQLQALAQVQQPPSESIYH